MNKRILYFGRMRDKGHYLFADQGVYIKERMAMAVLPGVNELVFKYIDAIYPPYNRKEGKYNDCVIPPLRIVSWWDYSVDSRPGSNSNLIGSMEMSAEDIIDEAYKIFPSVMNRQARPVKHEPI